MPQSPALAVVAAAAMVAAVACAPAPPAAPQPTTQEASPTVIDDAGTTRPPDATPTPEAALAGQLLARPGRPAAEAAPPRGLRPLGLGGRRDGLVFVPSGYRPDRPAPLLVMFHGAGGDARSRYTEDLFALAEERGVIVVVPESRGSTWDVIVGGFGPDVAFVDRVLASVFRRYAIDQERVAVGGFSDGASYALSLGMTNGDLFDAILAFSPGFSAPARMEGRPRLFVSHGTDDGVLPIDATSRRIVPAARRAGYDVTYEEFEGGHMLSREIAAAGLDWLLGEQ
ncbi:MAG: alpha/beta hydrolase-fold protein [Actinomycetota bacterium]|nr:alpha/beta hydrolase-fold protein [Actinomycetota bacterium]